MILQTLKTKALLILSGLVGFLVFLLSIFGARTRRLKQRNRQLEASYQKSREVIQKDLEITEQTRARRVDALKELDETGESSIFNDPNSLRDNDP